MSYYNRYIVVEQYQPCIVCKGNAEIPNLLCERCHGNKNRACWKCGRENGFNSRGKLCASHEIERRARIEEFSGEIEDSIINISDQ